MKMNNLSRQTERGSVFFFILIGVAMFAALSYAVTQSLRGGTTADGASLGTAERNTTHVTDLMQYLEALKMRVFEMTNVNGIAEGRLDFRNDVYLLAGGAEFTGNNNSSCAGTENCSVFTPYGTNGLIPMTFPLAAVQTAQTSASALANGHGRVGEVDISGVGTTAPDLVFLIQGIRPEICNLYNNKQGITTAYTDLTTMSSISESANAIPDVFAGFVTPNSFGYGATIFAGRKSFCAPALNDIAPNRLAIWHVLRAR